MAQRGETVDGVENRFFVIIGQLQNGRQEPDGAEQPGAENRGHNPLGAAPDNQRKDAQVQNQPDEMVL